MRMLRRTRSLCPSCLRIVDARYEADLFGNARLVKTCPEHGAFQVPVWAAVPGLSPFEDWKNSTRPSRPVSPATANDKGCPFDCGLCPEHAQQTCCALLEVTSRCNMGCPVCYASASREEGDADPDRDALADMLDALRRQGGLANVQLSGGEPTVREDLPEIIRLVRAKGFPFVQLNTNGLRLAREAGYARRLRESGLDLVYLQWDGLRESTFRALRGGAYLPEKEEAARRCVEAGLPVVLVATVVRGVNEDELGDLLRAALALGPYARGLHVQPMAAFGRSPWNVEEAPRLTLPDIMIALERQSGGLVHARDFHPPGSEHALCSFSALYNRTDEGGLEHVPGVQSCCGTEPRPEAHKARDFVARHWGGIGRMESGPGTEPERAGQGDFEKYIADSGIHRRFTLSAMAFQDAYSLDLERVRRCHIHIVTRDGRLIPFCMYNMTSTTGAALYRGV